jgi:GTP 3',8-cyclase
VRAVAGLGHRVRTRGDNDPLGSSWSLSRRGVRANPTPEPHFLPHTPRCDAFYADRVSRRSIPVPLVDAHARRVRDLRISITDRCNFRCTYCMPVEGMEWLPRDQLLTYEEIARIARVCVERFGFESIRLTGGEPLVRAHIVRLVELLAPLGVDLALTTNGVKLPELAHDLAGAGLERVNVSLDSLRRDVFLALTRRDELDRVIAGIDAALDAGMRPVKVNCVVMRGVNDDEVVDLAAFGRSKGVGMRFIEFMPLDADEAWNRDKVVPAREILERIDAVFPLESTPSVEVDIETPGGHVEPAARYQYRDGQGDVGVIASVTEPFCDNCDRVRLTAEGKLRTCLFALDETDLRVLVRGASDLGDNGLDDPELDDRLADALVGAVGKKWAGHRIGQVDFIRPGRSMSQIGG